MRSTENWPNGLLKTVTENGHTTYREYDTLNRLKRYDDGEGHTLTYTYYPSGELKTIVYPGDKTVTYDYDDFGRLFHVTDWSNRVTTYTYDNASRLKQISRPNGTYRVQEYDAASQLRFVKEYTSGNAVIAFEELNYDDDGRIKSQFLHPKPIDIVLPFDNLLYDDDNRLTNFNSASTNVTFDADGNMTTGPLPSGAISIDNYGYDSRNRLTRADTTNYRYNPDGLRVEITGTGAATFVIDPNAALSRTLMRTKGGVPTYYVYGLGLLYEETSGATKTYHADHVGSTLAMTSDSQSVTDRWTYAQFGAIAQRTGTTDTPFQFNGELGVQTDANGLLHMRARYYNPRIMRFCNADPIGFGGGLNHYAYCENNPVSFADPFGLERQNANGARLTGQDIVAQIEALGQLASELDQSRSWLARLFSSNPYRAEAQSLIQLLNAVGAGIDAYNAVAAPGTKIDAATFDFGSADTASLQRLGGAAQNAALLLANYAAFAASSTGSTLAKALNADGSLNVSATVARQLAVGGSRSWIPTQSVLDTIRTGSRVADPQGVSGQFMYRAPFSFTRSGVGTTGSQTSSGTLEVLVHEPSGQIRHILYRSGQ